MINKINFKTMSTIPKTPEEKIHNYAKSIAVDIKYLVENAEVDHYRIITKAAEYGYQLATDGREELEKENERLKMLIKDAYYYRTGGPRDDHGWQQFKSANKL